MRTSALVYMFLAALLLVPAACGGGGGGGGGGPATDPFLGTYSLSQFRGVIGPPLEATAYWSTFSFDGLGSLTGGTTSSITNGTLGGPMTSPAGSATYTILGGNALQFTSGAVTTGLGGMSADGALWTMGVVAPGSGASIVCGARHESGLSVASLNGRYHYAQFLTSASGTSDASFWGWVDFDGGGNASYSIWSNIDGTISGAPATVPGTYTVAANGTLTLTLGTATYRGSVARGGALGFFSGSTIAGGPAGLGVLIRYSTAATNAMFSGTYHTTAIIADAALAPAINWRATTGTTMADGAGSWAPVAVTLIDDAGTVSPISGPFLPTSYTVAPNGGMVFTGAVGAIASDGSVAALIGGTTAGSGPVLYIMIR